MSARPKVWVAELAAHFWAAVGETLPFPRDLRAALCWLPSLHVVGVPRLTLALAADHFTRRGVPCAAPAEDRPLAGCFGGHRGTAVILFDPTLDPAEVRFTLAHEAAHFLRDYHKPRRSAVARLGPRALEVFDGLREPTVNERLAGVLRDVKVGPLTHFLDRGPGGCAATRDAQDAEDAADRLAYELLAPFDEVVAHGPCGRDALADRLASEFGLPPREAANYATILLDSR